jgi:hypothetical protein
MNAPEALFPSNWTKAKKQADLLKVAKSILLEPTGLTEQDLHRTFGDIFSTPVARVGVSKRALLNLEVSISIKVLEYEQSMAIKLPLLIRTKSI